MKKVVYVNIPSDFIEPTTTTTLRISAGETQITSNHDCNEKENIHLTEKQRRMFAKQQCKKGWKK